MLGAVRAIAGELHRTSGAELDDLIADGLVGALKAAKAFEPDRGWQFNTYARHRIRGEMIDGLRRMDYLVRSERTRVTEEIAASRAANQEYQDTRTALPISLDIPVGPSGELTIGGLLPDPSKPFEDQLSDGQLITQLVNVLDSQHRLLIEMYYWRGASLTEIAQGWGVVPSRTSQLHHEAVRMMQLEAMRLGVRPARMMQELRSGVRARRNRVVSASDKAELFGDPLAHWAGE